MNVLHSWPRSALVAIAILIVLSATGLRWIYRETREAYRAVGFSDGQIHQREQILKKIQQSVTIQACPQHPVTSPPVEFLSIKSDSIYIMTVDGNRVQFCR
jgi:hypothetical protein